MRYESRETKGNTFEASSIRLPPNYSFSPRLVHVLVACGSFRPNTNFEIVGGYLNPVSDMYKKADLASTTVVLDHFDHELNVVLVGVQTEDGQHRNVQLEVMLLAGSDLIRTLPFFPRCCYSNVLNELLRRGLSVRYLLPSRVIEENNLYLDEAAAAEKQKGKRAATEGYVWDWFAPNTSRKL
ncbi:hypothetical protein F5890DRAFT_1575629 [Lentinula detonsa]|uniref:Uncharacterized protein n=1 Tax=Lentinula detonsa TaxID=2804962 RepID=A0AA38UNP6_9AGAR|nr:hypothetical protein F5890DRAFT_1575629 [Lentinula detonsa]